jgi:uncharacterized glyoxalase superfamily protein PhnB
MTTQSIQLASVRLITNDLAGVVHFYEVLTGVAARYITDDFAEVITQSATLGISAASRVAFIVDNTPQGGANNSAFVEFLVEDVDAVYQQLVSEYGDTLNVLQEPATMPWGNRSLLLRDPEGTPVNIYAPVTAAGIALQQSRTPAMVQPRA